MTTVRLQKTVTPIKNDNNTIILFVDIIKGFGDTALFYIVV